MAYAPLRCNRHKQSKQVFLVTGEIMIKSVTATLTICKLHRGCFICGLAGDPTKIFRTLLTNFIIQGSCEDPGCGIIV